MVYHRFLQWIVNDDITTIDILTEEPKLPSKLWKWMIFKFLLHFRGTGYDAFAQPKYLSAQAEYDSSGYQIIWWKNYK